MQTHVIHCAPVTPSLRPSKPDVAAPNKGKAKMDKYI